MGERIARVEVDVYKSKGEEFCTRQMKYCWEDQS